MPPTPPDQPVVRRETDQWLVVNKPAGWHSVRAGSRARGGGEGDEATPASPVLQEWLEEVRPELRALPECGLAHRLDLPTSGCVLVARDSAALDRLRAMVQGEEPGLRKVYLALARGRVADGSFDLFFRSRYRRSRRITVSARGEESERGRCRWRACERLGGHTLLEVEIIGPGRRHQIRAGLAHLGHPLRGDALYGGESWDGRLGLHAWMIEVDGVQVAAPPPESWNLQADLQERSAPRRTRG